MVKEDLNTFYYNLLHIKKDEKKTLDVIDNIVVKNKRELLDITNDIKGFCKVMANNIGSDLALENIKNCILNTKDIINSYEHEFIIACYEENNQLKYILIDPTYEQFIEEANSKLISTLKEWPTKVLSKTDKGKSLLINLLMRGYSDVDELDVKLYLNSFIDNNINNIDFKLNDIILDKVGLKIR